VSPQNPLQTAIRVFKKVDDLECHCDIHEEMIILKHIFFCHDKVFTRRFAKETYDKYLKYKNQIDQHFSIFKIEKPDSEDEKIEGEFGLVRSAPRGLYMSTKDLWGFTPIINEYIPPLKLDTPTQILNYFRFKSNKTTKNKRKKFDTLYNTILSKCMTTLSLEKDEVPYTGGHGHYYDTSVKHKVSIGNTMQLIENRYLTPHGITFFSYFKYQSWDVITNMLLLKSLSYGEKYLDCDFHEKNIIYLDGFYCEHRSIFGFVHSCGYAKTLQDEVNLVKSIKSLANKKGDWVIGELENLYLNVEQSRRLDEIGIEPFIVEYIELKEKEETQILVEPVDLTDFEYNGCVKELTSKLELKREGNKMGHCVGGYSNSLLEGRSRIFHIECDGIGSTVEISMKMGSLWFTLDTERNRKPIPTEWEELAEYHLDVRDGIRELQKYDYHIYDDTPCGVSQHYGKYPIQKGNATPTETNVNIVESLVKFINENHYKTVELPKLLMKRHEHELFMFELVKSKKETPKEKETIQEVLEVAF
jgi:hypothetical protein